MLCSLEQSTLWPFLKLSLPSKNNRGNFAACAASRGSGIGNNLRHNYFGQNHICMPCCAQVAGQTYTLALHFAELYFETVGQRVFTVIVNDQAVLPDYDIIADAGEPFSLNLLPVYPTSGLSDSRD